MTVLSPDLLLETWARARSKPPAGRAVAVLEAAHADKALDALSIGERDRMLLALFETNFGDALKGTGVCSACGAELDLALNVHQLLAKPALPGSPTVMIEGVAVSLRLPTVAAVVAAARAANPSRHLAAWCIGRDDEASLDDVGVAQIGEALLAADPLLDPEIGGACPDCGAEQTFGLDVASFVWERIEARARRLIGEVHLLARAYGWSERDILDLPPARRSAYLAMVGA